MKCDATKAMEDARAGLISKHPSLGYLCFKLSWFPDSTARTAWTDGISVGFNPDYVLGLSKAERQFLAAHEVAHPMLGHHLRRNGRDPEKWNIACDHVVNLILQDQRLTLTKGALLDWQFKGMAVEQVYNMLFPPGQDNDDGNQDSTESGQNGDSSPDNSNQAPGDGSGQEDGSQDENGGDKGDSSSDETSESDSDQAGGPEGQDGEQSGEDTGTGSDDSGASGQDGSTGKGSGKGLGQPDQGGDTAEDSDSGAGKESGEADQDYGPGEVRDFPGEAEEDFDMEAEKWDLAVQQAAQMARKLEGDVPGFVETMLTNINDPKLPWTEILSRWLTSKAKNDYSWTKPNPRYSSTGFFMPALESFDLGKLAMFWDTSCSVTDDQVADIGAETQGILTHFPGVLIDLYHIDTKVQYIEEINQYTDWDQITAKGRGGTDFRPGFTAIEEGEEEYPIGVIYMTDGECSKFPEEAPSYPVLWIVVDMPQDMRFEPPFGEVAYYNDF